MGNVCSVVWTWGLKEKTPLSPILNRCKETGMGKGKKSRQGTSTFGDIQQEVARG